MGAWDSGTFDNDDASDWLYDLEESSDASTIKATLTAVTDADDDELEAPDCACALAAAEIVAALLGNPLENLPDNAQKWVDTHEGLEVSSLVKVSLKAVERIRTSSELKELWDKSKDSSEWYGALDELTSRLKNC